MSQVAKRRAVLLAVPRVQVTVVVQYDGLTT